MEETILNTIQNYISNTKPSDFKYYDLRNILSHVLKEKYNDISNTTLDIKWNDKLNENIETYPSKIVVYYKKNNESNVSSYTYNIN